MKTVTSISGGMTSAYLAANYPTDFNVFSLIRVEDKNCQFKDRKIASIVEDKIKKPFIGTVEDDTIIYTMLDLEQYLGKKIDWVSGETFDFVVAHRGGYLPNKLHRYCTTEMKLKPIYNWWKSLGIGPIQMNIGYRANETARVKKMNDRLNKNGLLEMDDVIGKSKNGKRNKWGVIEWQKPSFPLVDDQIYREDIKRFWKDKNVRFAKYNNCIGCFHRNVFLLRQMFDSFPEKMKWFESKETKGKGFWKDANGQVIPYSMIKKTLVQSDLFGDSSSCDDGFCEID